MRRVVITGAGSWNGFGAGVPRFLEALQNACCAIGDMTLFPTAGFRTGRAAVAPTPVASTADVLAHAFGCTGARATVVTACSSSANSLGFAADLIQEGRADA